MIDINKHKFLLLQILKDIYADIELANWLGFKGGTALMFFYDLPRFSVDLDFNMIDIEKEDAVYAKVRNILLRYGTIFDEAKKFYGLLIVLNYGFGERKLKVEISKRISDDRYEIKNLLGINVRVMVREDMFAHKLCALLDRKTVTSRDIFECWFFMENRTPLNISIIESRMGMPLTKYLQKCIENLESKSDKGLLQGIGDLMDEGMKKFVQTKLREEVIGLLKFYMNFPLVTGNGKTRTGQANEIQDN
jgi:predicted nucleotidyltransferase component of viral defense system